MRSKIIWLSLILPLSLVGWERNGIPIAKGPGDQTDARLIVPEGKDYFYVV